MGAFALVYLLMSLTYFRLATTNKGSKKVKYTGKGYTGSSAIFALTKKELGRYCKNGMVMLNTFMGSVLLVLLPILALFKKESFLQLAQVLQGEFPLILAAILCVSVFSNLLTPSSISMEGESLDVVRVLPVKTQTIFWAKSLAGVLTTGIPAVFACVVLSIVFKQSVGICACILLMALVCSVFSSMGGVAINLLLPNLKWTNEVAVVKQSASTMVAMLGGWGVVVLLIGGYFLFGKYLPAWGYLLVCAGILSLACFGVYVWLKNKGVKIFEAL
jgi:ABC-2 type transport system permease protein